jgi:hypothetical protein
MISRDLTQKACTNRSVSRFISPSTISIAWLP